MLAYNARALFPLMIYSSPNIPHPQAVSLAPTTQTPSKSRYSLYTAGLPAREVEVSRRRTAHDVSFLVVEEGEVCLRLNCRRHASREEDCRRTFRTWTSWRTCRTIWNRMKLCFCDGIAARSRSSRRKMYKTCLLYVV
jgi:hypothetical protein